jgi:hypothetical protein
MYVQTHHGLGQRATPSLAAPPNASAGDALTLSEAAKLAKAVHGAFQQLEQSLNFSMTTAHKDLLREVVAILRVFFPVGFGVVDKNGKVIKPSVRYRTEVIPKSPPRISQQLVPMQFLRSYFRKYWSSDPKDRAALKTKDAERVFGTMEADLLKLVAAVQTHVGP